MKKAFAGFFSAACSAVILTGCCAFPEAMATRGPHDEMVDDENRPHVQNHIRIYAERQKFRQAIVVKPNSANVELLLSNRKLPQFSVDFKRDVLFAIESNVSQWLASRKDFSVVNPDVEKIPDDVATVYYDITNMTAKAVDNSYRNSNGQYVERYYWDLGIEMNISLVKNNKVLFTLASANSQRFSVNSLHAVPLDDMKALIPAAVQNIVEQYDIKFGPPVYVVELIGNGKFAKLSTGSDYGYTRGRTVEFFRHSLKKVLDPASGEERMQYTQVSLGTGTLGDTFCFDGCKVPEGNDFCWAYIPWNAEPESNKVYIWTSVRLVR